MTFTILGIKKILRCEILTFVLKPPRASRLAFLPAYSAAPQSGAALSEREVSICGGEGISLVTRAVYLADFLFAALHKMLARFSNPSRASFQLALPLRSFHCIQTAEGEGFETHLADFKKSRIELANKPFCGLGTRNIRKITMLNRTHK